MIPTATPAATPSASRVARPASPASPCPLRALGPDEMAALQRKLVAFARRSLRDPHAAEDAAADTLLALLEAPAAYRGESQLHTYAIGVLKHKIVDRIRGRSRESTEEPATLELEADHAPGPEARLDDAQQVDRFWRTLRGAVGGLPQRLRTAFWLRDVVDCDTRTLCDHLQVTEGHAHVLLHRARRQLRNDWHAAEAALA
ncbi:MAG TPA: sigma-70 family RNA polymerase sigma factor [Burkholderiaceae bacterium]|nr:sigma-70 family RNA polymerase sigma factor [Burkholderiaceae bacterium]